MAAQAPEKKGNNVLVVDDFALSIINAAVSQNELLKGGFMTVCPFETKKEIADGKRRRHYTTLDVLYFMRPKKNNLLRIVDDYKQEVPVEKPDIIERLFPCILKGIPEEPKEPPMYADARLLVIPGQSQSQGLHNWQLAHDWLQNQIENRGKELERLGKALKLNDDKQSNNSSKTTDEDSDGGGGSRLDRGAGAGGGSRRGSQNAAQAQPPIAKECVVEYMAYESNMFSLDMPRTLSTVYTHSLSAGVLEGREAEELRDSVFDHLDTVAHRMMTALVTAGEYPYIRYTHSARGISEVVARSLLKQLKAWRDLHPAFVPWGDPKAYEDPITGARRVGPPEAATVIICDRVDDLAPALMHDVTYQCLVSDLLDHEPCTPFRYAYKKGGIQVEKDVLLDETDPVWRHLRNDDMGTVMETVDEAVRLANARADARKRLDPNDVHDLRELMSVLAGDEKLVDEKFAQHYRMKSNIVEAYERRNLQDVITLEQVLATGCDSEGNHVNSKRIEALLKELLRDQRLESEDKARLLALYILCNKSVDSKVRSELTQMAGLTRTHQTAVSNLVNVHVPLQRTASEPRPESSPFLDDDTLARNKKQAKDSKRLCRYISKAEDIVKNQVEDTLPEDAYPWVRQPPAKGAGGTGGASSALNTLDGRVAPQIAMHGAHGEVVNKYTAAALASAPTDTSNIKSNATKKSRFAAGGGGGGGKGGNKGNGRDDRDAYGNANNNDGDDGGAAMLSRYLEPVKNRVYEGGRVFVFFIGGITQSEMAALDRLSKETNREIIVGGTSVMTARDCLEELESTDPSGSNEDGGGFGGAGVGDQLRGAGVDDFY